MLSLLALPVPLIVKRSQQGKHERFYSGRKLRIESSRLARAASVSFEVTNEAGALAPREDQIRPPLAGCSQSVDQVTQTLSHLYISPPPAAPAAPINDQCCTNRESDILRAAGNVEASTKVLDHR